MIILITLIIMLVIGIIISNRYDYGWKEVIGMLMTIISSIGLLIALIGLPIERITVYGEIAEYKSVQLTVEQARNDDNRLENVALQHKIIDCNKWLASQLYYNSTLFDIWIPDEILELKPIK